MTVPLEQGLTYLNVDFILLMGIHDGWVASGQIVGDGVYCCTMATPNVERGLRLRLSLGFRQWVFKVTVVASSRWCGQGTLKSV